MSRYFFFSYAHQNYDSYLKIFITGLKAEVALLSGAKVPEVGFVDDYDIAVGQQWPHALSAALNDSNVLLALYSPAYFQRPVCGKEWMAFRMRQEMHMKVLGQADAPPVILPILWIPAEQIENIPYVARDIHYSHALLGKEYAQVGLRQLIKLGKYADQYTMFQSRLAKLIVDTGKKVKLTRLPVDPPLDALENAFAIPTPGGDPARPDEIGPRYVKFMYVAARRGELAKLRSHLDGYGDEGGHQWQPYHPHDPDEVAVVAQRVASDKGLYYEALPVDEHAVRRIEQAHQNRNLVILIVDAWTVRVPDPYYNTMRELDEKEHLLYVVVIPSNESDEESLAASDLLAQALQAAFHHRSSLPNSPYYISRITSVAGLAACLSEIMETMRERIVADAPPLELPPEVPQQPIPVISPIPRSLA